MPTILQLMIYEGKEKLWELCTLSEPAPFQNSADGNPQSLWTIKYVHLVVWLDAVLYGSEE